MVKIVHCPHCSRRVIPSADRECPSCRRNVDAPIGSPHIGDRHTSQGRVSLGRAGVSDLTVCGWFVLIGSVAIVLAVATPLACRISQEFPDLFDNRYVARGLAVLCAPVLVVVMVACIKIGAFVLDFCGLPTRRASC